ncbi:hypothetical protein OHR68_09870 [Spirillospora sp. NBC_00431]
MICQHCRDRQHHECRGGTWCDCQHQPPVGERDQAAAPPADIDRAHLNGTRETG